jgi:hypothetical protein
VEMRINLFWRSGRVNEKVSESVNEKVSESVSEKVRT